MQNNIFSKLKRLKRLIADVIGGKNIFLALKKPIRTEGKPNAVEIDNSTELPLLTLEELLQSKNNCQAIVVPEEQVQVIQHALSVSSSNESEHKFYCTHTFRAPELRLERLTDQYWFPESGFLISKQGKAWRHSILGQYGDPNFLTTYAVEERINDDKSKSYFFYEHLLHNAPIIDAPYLITSHYASHNFGHFMLDMVPLIQLAFSKNLTPISKPLLNWQNPIYQIVGFDPNTVKTVKHRAVLLKEVFVSNRHNAESTYAASPNHRQVFADLFHKLPASNPAESKFERIFISRGVSRNRDIKNRTALELALRDLGFTIIRPEEFSFERQARLFSQADIIVSEFGAVMANVVFCRPGTKIIELIPENQNDPWSSHLCASMKLEHITLFHKVDDADREAFEIGGRIHTNIFFKFEANIPTIVNVIKKLN
jgi:capsular polysaccharide biosynthesis protein